MRSRLGRTMLGAAALGFAVAAMPGEGGISQEEMIEKIQNARTRMDHEELALIYEKHASADLEAAEEHRRMASQYKRLDPSPLDRSTFKTMAIHCYNLVELYMGAAKEHSALAALHREAAR